jgi:hypothetical protein
MINDPAAAELGDTDKRYVQGKMQRDWRSKRRGHVQGKVPQASKVSCMLEQHRDCSFSFEMSRQNKNINDQECCASSEAEISI